MMNKKIEDRIGVKKILFLSISFVLIPKHGDAYVRTFLHRQKNIPTDFIIIWYLLHDYYYDHDSDRRYHYHPYQ